MKSIRSTVATNNILVLIILLTSLISIYSLLRQSIRLDEAQSIWFYSKSVPEMLKMTSQDVNLPLYGLILHFWLQIFGVDINKLRLLSLIFYILTIPFLYKTIKESSNHDHAMLTTALFSFSPFIAWYTSEARTYALFTLIVVLNNMFFLRLITTNGKDGKTGLFLTTIAGLYTHYFFVFLLITQCVYTLVLKVIKEKNRTVPAIFFSILVSAVFLFSPWLIYVIQSGIASNTQPLIPPPSSYNVIQTFVNFIFGFQPQPIQAILISLWPLLTVVLFLMFTNKKQKNIKNLDYYFLATFLPVVLVFFISFIKPIFLSRYLILVTPTLFFIIAWIILNNSKKASFYLSVVSLTVMFLLLLFQNISANTPVKENYSKVSQYLSAYTTPQDVVAITAPFTIYPIEYQYKGEAKLVTIPNWDRYVQGPMPKFNLDEFTAQMSQYQKQYNRVFVIFSYDQGYEQDVRNYLDKHYALMGNGDFNNIEMRVYKLKY
jgi:uncharacterized membrane protein